MKRLSILNGLVFLMSLLLVACSDRNYTSFYFKVNDDEFGDRYHKMTRVEHADTADYYHLSYLLDSNFNKTQESGNEAMVEVSIIDSIIDYEQIEFSLSRMVGTCHVFNDSKNQDTIWDQTTCLIRNIKDTVINGIPIRDCSVYNLQREGEITELLIFDWTNRVVLEIINLDTKKRLLELVMVE
jgi:hypothetical protein